MSIEPYKYCCSQQYNITQNFMEKEKARPIPFIIPKNDADSNLYTFQINEQAIDLLCKAQGPLSVVSICGQHRSGKSFLLNTLFFSGKGFKVSNTTQPCTKGLVLWTKPIVNKGTNIWIIDSQGFGSTQKDAAYDGKIFLLTTLLSSVLIYNSFGPLDETALQKFMLICKQAKMSNQDMNVVDLYWIMRDFSLVMESKQGKAMTANQYMENSLKIKNHDQVISRFFRQKNCIPLVRPTINEDKLSIMQKLDLKDLRTDFIDSVYRFKKKLFSQIEPKRIKSMTLTPRMFCDLVRQYLMSINQKRQCSLLASWEMVQNSSFQRLASTLLPEISKKITLYKKKLPFSCDEIKTINNQILQQCYFKIKASFPSIQKTQRCWKQLQSEIKKELSKLQQANINFISEDFKKEAKTHFRDLCHKLQNLLTINTFPNQIFEQFSQLKKQLLGKYGSIPGCQLIYNKLEYEQLSQILLIFSEKIKKTINSQQQKYEQIKQKNHILQNQVKQNQTSQSQIKRQLNKKIEESKEYFMIRIQALQSQLENSKAKEAKTAENTEKQFQRLFDQLKNTELQATQLRQEKISLLSRVSDQTKSYQHKIQLLEIMNKQVTEKLQNLTNEYEQKTQQYEKKLQEIEQKYTQAELNLTQQLQQAFECISNQRIKYQNIYQQRKDAQDQLLNQLGSKNFQISQLRKQIKNLEQSLKQSFNSIISNEKRVFDDKIQRLTDQRENLQKQLELYENKVQRLFQDNQALEHNLIEYQQLQKQWKQKSKQYQSMLEKITNYEYSFENNLKNHEKIIEQLKMSYEQKIVRMQRQIEEVTTHQKETCQNYAQQLFQMKRAVIQTKEQCLKQQQQKASALANHYQSIIKQNQSEYESQIVKIQQQFRKQSKIVDQLKIEKENLSKQYENLWKKYKQLQIEKRQIEKNICQQCQIKKQQQNTAQKELVTVRELLEKHEKQKHSSEYTIKQLKQVIDTKEFMIKDITMKKEKQNLIATSKIEKLQQEKVLLKEELHRSQYKIRELDRALSNKQQQNKFLNETILRKEQLYTDNMTNFRVTIDKLRQQNSTIRTLKTSKVAKVELKNKVEQGNNIFHINSQIKEKYLTPNFNVSDNVDSCRVQFQNKLQQKEEQIKQLKKLLEQQRNSSDNNRRKFQNDLQQFSKEHQRQDIQKLTNQNRALKKKIDEIYQREVRLIQSKRINRSINRNNDIQQSRIKSLKQQFETYKKFSQSTKTALQNKLSQVTNENTLLKQQIIFLQAKTTQQHNNYSQKLLKHEIQILKKQIKQMQQTNLNQLETHRQIQSSKKQQFDRRIAQMQINYKQLKIQSQKTIKKLTGQVEKSHSKYEQILRINSDLFKQVEANKNRSNPQKFSQKYKEKINNLFSYK